jgi:hypothetical protein
MGTLYGVTWPCNTSKAVAIQTRMRDRRWKLFLRKSLPRHNSLHYPYTTCPWYESLSSFDANDRRFVASPHVFKWSNEELTVAIYFSSRQIRSEALRCLLFRRGYIHSTRAIERKLVFIDQQNLFLRSSKGCWDLIGVDYWMDDLLGSSELVNQEIQFSPDDAEDVELVSCNI